MIKDSTQRKYHKLHRDRINARRRKRRAEDPEKYRQIEINRFKKEDNWIKDMFIRARVRAKKDKIPFTITLPQLFAAWDKHKKKYGKRCAYTLQPLTFIRHRGTITWSNISLDKLDPKKGYTLRNIVFCNFAFNMKKHKMTFKDCQAVIRVYKDTR